jgi:fructose-1,6-bisphosphatase/inositol monophosphatase family enzyme
LNGKPIRCSSIESIGEAKVGVGFSANKPKIDRYYADWGDLLDSCQKGIPLIAPALSICSVARGRLDMFIDNGSSMEGHAGAALILMAAGGFVRNYDLTEWDHRTKGIMAANHSLGNVLAER